MSSPYVHLMGLHDVQWLLLQPFTWASQYSTERLFPLCHPLLWFSWLSSVFILLCLRCQSEGFTLHYLLESFIAVTMSWTLL